MAKQDHLVVIGGGQAGLQVAASARAASFGGTISIVANEAELPYQRPPLSKSYLLGKQSRESLALQKPAFYEKHEIQLIAGTAALEIDRAHRQVRLANGAALSFRHLVLATGARNRPLPAENANLDGVVSLRSLADADELIARTALAEKIVVIGGGFIGLEFAAVASTLRKKVTVVEAQPFVLARAVPELLSSFYRQVHERRGVEFKTSAKIARIAGRNGKVEAVTLADGAILPADLVLVGIGVTPNDQLAASAGLATADGIVVDHTLRTTDNAIFAIGDCATFPSADGNHHRIESVQNAIDQGRHVAQAIVGSPASYTSVPWFWSDQYEFKLQIAGLTSGADNVILRGTPDDGRFSHFLFRRGRLIAVASVNRPADHVIARRMLASGCTISPAEAQDLDVDLRAQVERQSLSDVR